VNNGGSTVPALIKCQSGVGRTIVGMTGQRIKYETAALFATPAVTIQ